MERSPQSNASDNRWKNAREGNGVPATLAG